MQAVVFLLLMADRTCSECGQALNYSCTLIMCKQLQLGGT